MKIENTHSDIHQDLSVVEATVATVDTMSLSTKAKRRMRTTREETAVLEDFFNKNPNPNQVQKEEIATTVQMGVRNVHFWFQNRRAKDNKKRKMVQLRQQQELAQQQYAATNQHLFPNYQQPPPVYHYNNINNSFIGSGNTPQQYNAAINNNIKGKGKAVSVTDSFNLPPISTIMVPNFHNLSIPFYFHHSKFGIADCMLQWSTTTVTSSPEIAAASHNGGNDNASGGAIMAGTK